MSMLLHSLSGIVAIDDGLPGGTDPERDITIALNASLALKEAMEKSPALTENITISNPNDNTLDNTLGNSPTFKM